MFNFGIGVSIPAQAGDSDNTLRIENLLERHNEERKKLGLGELILNSSLSFSARSKAEAMMGSDCWDHYCPDGKPPWDFFGEAGYEYVFAGENLAEGFYNVNSVMRAWLNSPTHRENILRPQYYEIGFGIVNGDFQGNKNNIIIAVHFGSQKNDVNLTNSDNNLFITEPKQGSIFSSPDIEVTGVSDGYDQVFITNNSEVVGPAVLSGEGLFTYDLTGLTEGDHVLGALSYESDGEQKRSAPVSIRVQKDIGAGSNLGEFSPEADSFKGSSLLGLELSSSKKNLINLIFVVLFIFLFLFDFALVSKTDVLKRDSLERSFSHFHFAMFILVALIIISGGFAGEIGNGLQA